MRGANVESITGHSHCHAGVDKKRDGLPRVIAKDRNIVSYRITMIIEGLCVVKEAKLTGHRRGPTEWLVPDLGIPNQRDSDILA